MNPESVVVLIVDDDDSTRLYISRLLEQQRYQIITAANGREALDLLQEQSVDMVLLDIIMPQVDGYQVLQSIKADPKLRHIPVMMMSAVGDVDRAAWCIEKGAEDCLTKPLNPVLLKARIHAYLERKWLRDQEQAYLHQLQAEKTAAEAAHRAKNAFLANMSHELRTPLNAIIGYSEILQEDLQSEGCADLLPDVDKICTSGKHLLGLIDGILDLAKIESGRMELYLENFDIQTLLHKLIEQIQPIAAINQNTLVLQCDDHVDDMTSDLGKVRQILWNLLDNANKFTHKGTVTVTTQVQNAGELTNIALASTTCIVFRICDTGIGIPVDQQERIFNIFTQGDESKTRKYNGVGLGLTISQRLCQLLGGSISVTSQEDYGSIFTVCLPVKTPSTSQVPEIQAAASRSEVSRSEWRQAPLGEAIQTQSASLDPVSPSLSPHSDLVLVIDDDRIIRDWMVQTLNQDGYRVVTTWHGGEGLRLARELSPNWIVLNMLLPDLDCWSVLSALKDDPGLAKIPVILQVTPPIDRSAIEPDDRSTHPGVVLGIGDRLAKASDFKRLLTQLQVFQQQVPAAIPFDRTGIDRTERNNCILSIQSDPTTQQILQRLLAKAGWTVLAASSYQTALAHLQTSSPDLILLDLMLPQLDSFHLLSHAQNPLSNQAIPVIALLTEDLTPSGRYLLTQGAKELLEQVSSNQTAVLQQLLSMSGNG